VDTDNPLVDLLALAQPETVDTQIEVLQSGPFLERVLNKATAGAPKDAKAPVIRAKGVRDTNIIDVSAEGADPKMAARVANTMADEYLEYTRENSLGEIQSAKRFVAKEHARSKQALADAERDLLNFRKRNRVVQLTAEQESRTKEVVDLETRYRENENAVTRASAQLQEVKAQLQQEPEVRRIPSGRENPRRDALDAKLAELETQRAALLAEYRPHDPTILTLDAQIARVRQKRDAEPAERVLALTAPNPAREDLRSRVKELDRDLRGLQAERDQLSAQLASKRERMNQLGPWEIQLAQLNRARDTAEKSFLMLQGKLEDLSIRENARRSNARIVERAGVPAAPVRPRKSVNLAIAVMLGTVLGLAVAFLQEYLDDRITTPEEVDRVLGLPVLGHVPLIPAHHSPLMTDLPPRSRTSESYRALRSAIGFAAVDHPLRTLVVSSAGAGEGKSLTSLNLAIAMAMEGRRVILVDADLRRPSVHKTLGWEPSPGLTDVLVGSRELSEALRPFEAAPGLRILTAGAPPPNPAELLNSAPMEELLAQLAGDADMVILDCPPALAVSDALLLSAKTDGVLLIADISAARRAGLRYTKEQFDRARAHIIGLLFNKVSRSDVGGYYYHYYPSTYYVEEPNALGNGHSANGHRNGRHAEPKRRALTAKTQKVEEPGDW